MTFPGGMELFVILFIVLLLFGAKKLPGLAGSLGTSLKEFKKATREAAEDHEAGAAAVDTTGTTDGSPAATGHDR